MSSILDRMRFAALWLVVAVALAGTMTVFFYEPGVLEEGAAGVMEGDPVTVASAWVMAVMLMVPLALAVASVVVSGRANVVLNLVGGVSLGIAGLLPVVNHVAAGEYHVHLALAVFATAIAWLIVGLSIAALRRSAPKNNSPESERLGLAASAKG